MLGAGCGVIPDARLADDRLIIASINKAIFDKNHQYVIDNGLWDVVIVDECHHLSDWGLMEETKPLVSTCEPASPEHSAWRSADSMSGTHQGSDSRFKNLLRLPVTMGDEERGTAALFTGLKIGSGIGTVALISSRYKTSNSGSARQAWRGLVQFGRSPLRGARSIAGRAFGVGKRAGSAMAASSVHAGWRSLSPRNPPLKLMTIGASNGSRRCAYRGGSSDEPVRPIMTDS